MDCGPSLDVLLLREEDLPRLAMGRLIARSRGPDGRLWPNAEIAVDAVQIGRQFPHLHA